VATGDPTGEEALASGSYFRQQWAGLRRFVTTVAGPVGRFRHPG
jgi:hypothetical protein